MIYNHQKVKQLRRKKYFLMNLCR